MPCGSHQSWSLNAGTRGERRQLIGEKPPHNLASVMFLFSSLSPVSAGSCLQASAPVCCPHLGCRFFGIKIIINPILKFNRSICYNGTSTTKN